MKNTEMVIIGYEIISLKIRKFIQEDLSGSMMVFSIFLGLFLSLVSIDPFLKMIGDHRLFGINDIIVGIIMIIFVISAIAFYGYILNGIGKLLIIYPIISKLTKIEQTITILQIKIGNNIKSTQDIDEILDKLGNIEILYKSLLLRKGLIYSLANIPRNIRLEFSSAVKDIFEWIMDIALNLRSDLSIRLAEQQSTLESTKSEVKKNITGTTELNQVSELQKTRLDRQIEQFEELQRVLVKV